MEPYNTFLSLEAKNRAFTCRFFYRHYSVGMKIFMLLAICAMFELRAAEKSPVPLEVTRLTDNFYVFTTYGTYKGEKIPANGLYLVTSQGVVMFDTTWDKTQLKPLLEHIQKAHHKKVIMEISTHFHADRTNGLDRLNAPE